MLLLLPHLRAYARSLAREPQAADDLLQDTLLRALQAWDRFEPGTNLKAWLFRILHNRFHTVVTSRHVKNEVAHDDLEHLAWTKADQEFRIELPGFKRAFARLKPEHREVLVLHAVNGLTYEQIAAICGCNIQAVKSRMNRARTALKKRLLDRDGPERAAVLQAIRDGQHSQYGGVPQCERPDGSDARLAERVKLKCAE